MNVRINEKQGVIAVLVLLFAALSVLSVTVIVGARQKDELLLRYDLERLTASLVEDYAEFRSYAQIVIPERVLGFGIYSSFRSSNIRHGDAPEQIPDSLQPDEAGPVFVRDRGDYTATFVRRIGMAPERGMGMGMQPRPRSFEPMHGRELGIAAYIRVDTSRFETTQILYDVAVGAAPAVIAVLLSLIGYFFLRSRELRRASEKQMQLARLGETARTLAHEIKNPLNAINIRARMVARSESNELSEEGRAIEREVARLRMLVDRIGDFLRDPAGSAELINPVDFIKEIIRSNGWAVKVLSSAPDPEHILFDRERFRSVVTNLITNAMEATAEAAGDYDATGEHDVAVHIEYEKKRVVISVLDRGKGMSEEERSRAFDAFYTTKAQGSGIGLAISDRFVRAAGGEIRIRQRRGGGTEMAVVLPKADV